MFEDEPVQFSFYVGNVYVSPADFSTYKLTFLMKSGHVRTVRVPGPKNDDI